MFLASESRIEMSNGLNETRSAEVMRRILGAPRYESIVRALRMPETFPAMRRYFINTVFDSTFVVLGVIIGTALVAEPVQRMVVLTIITSCMALMMSTAVAVYEAEKMEQRIRIMEIERAMLRRLDRSSIEHTSRISVMLIAGVNAFAPWLAATATLVPIVLITDMATAAWVAIGSAIALLFFTGLIMGRIGNKKRPVLNGFRMAAIGVVVFLLGMLIERSI